jgi:hypothetical protein
VTKLFWNKKHQIKLVLSLKFLHKQWKKSPIW